MAAVPRQYSQQVVHFLRKGITYADDGKTIVIGKIPSGSVIIKPMSGVHIKTVFNGNSSNVLDIGASTDSGTNNFATQLALGTATFVPMDEAVGDFIVTADTTVSMLVTSTASASAGEAEVFVCYIPDTDG